MKREEKTKTDYYKTHPCDESFSCRACGRLITPQGAGSRHRNHCPRCLASVHLDEEPGDRASGCGGLMEAVAVWVRRDGEWALIHRCKRCGVLHANRIAADDDPIKLMGLALTPLCHPPFPLEYLGDFIGRMDGAARE